MLEETLDKIIQEMTVRSEQLKEISSNTKDSSFIYESIGILKAIEIVKKYKTNVTT